MNTARLEQIMLQLVLLCYVDSGILERIPTHQGACLTPYLLQETSVSMSKIDWAALLKAFMGKRKLDDTRTLPWAPGADNPNVNSS